MREIKFRAYDTRLKMWCYDGEGFTIFGEVLMIDGFSSHFIENPVFDGEKYVSSLDRINDIALMQFTGLKDKNGKEIYEGDIVSAHGTNGVVTWSNELSLFELVVQVNGEAGTMTIYSSQEDGKNVHREVIGNIYANPELIDKTT